MATEHVYENPMLFKVWHSLCETSCPPRTFLKEWYICVSNEFTRPVVLDVVVRSVVFCVFIKVMFDCTVEISVTVPVFVSLDSDVDTV